MKKIISRCIIPLICLFVVIPGASANVIPNTQISHEQIQSLQKPKQSLETERVAKVFMEYINTEREKRSLHTYVWDDRLVATAKIWTEQMISSGNVTHTKPGGQSPHQWIKQFALPFRQDFEHNYFTENIFRGYFRCFEGCASTPEAEIHKRFADFLREERYNGSHFRSFVHQDFTHIGVSVIAVGTNQFYGTIHYARLEPESRIFPDIDPNHFARESIEYYAQKNLIKGWKDGLFHPEKMMTRAEALKLLAESVSWTAPFVSTKPFEDVSLDAWYAPYILWAQKEGLTQGFEDGTFRPDQPLSRMDALILVYRLMGKQFAPISTSAFEDIAPESAAAPHIHQAILDGAVQHPGKFFRPYEGIRRGEYLHILYKILPRF